MWQIMVDEKKYIYCWSMGKYPAASQSLPRKKVVTKFMSLFIFIFENES